ncbi:MAG: tRNA (adenosine(37)-N6)-dimethylallyltransferase MiaA [Crocinitomicaceae bacterium]|nr:tRNA (adenosine(37)-N6)-dimethylallyltransferase MiaA [Crocinitomicaceae bacterium]
MAKLNSPKYLIVIAGPTAVGKTAMSIQLANHFNCPILSFDSRQFYEELNIGTAKPTEADLSQADHHFINTRSIHEVYTSGMFENDAIQVLNEVYKQSDYCIAVGGSGLYIDALAYGIDNIPSSEEIRKQLFERWQNEGLEVLCKEVEKIDPSYFNSADMQNPRRVMRALEVYQLTGKPLSELRSSTKKNRDFEVIWVGLDMEIDQLYKRINDRVDQMISHGLVDEAKSLYTYKDLKALKTVGYQELMDYFDGVHELDKAIELIKRNSRRYAKKQFTWFRRNDGIKWFSPFAFESIIEYIESKTRN